MTQKRKLTVYIGRFSPFHEGHAEVLLRALRMSEKVLLIIGSANQPRTIKNPWTYDERKHIIINWLNSIKVDEYNLGNLIIRSARDWPYNDQLWLKQIQEIISEVEKTDIWITGADRDDSTFYLKEFPNYNLDLVEENRSVSKFLSATSIRDIYFGKKYNNSIIDDEKVDVLLRSFLPVTTFDYINEFKKYNKKDQSYSILLHEYETISARKAEKLKTQYEVIDQTVDSVVIQTGHVLLVKRRAAPGKGLWALPGGYLNPSEWMLDAAIRELKEETKIKIPEPVLRGSLKFDQRFEHPDRSLIGRVITQAFCFLLPDYLANGKVELPYIKGSDDAEKAKWFPLSDALKMSNQLFDDHHAILETFVSRLMLESKH